MTIQEQAEPLEHSLRQIGRINRQQWTTPEDKDEVVRTLKTQLTAADQTLQLPSTSGTEFERRKLLLWAEMARGTLKSLEGEGPRE